MHANLYNVARGSWLVARGSWLALSSLVTRKVFIDNSKFQRSGKVLSGRFLCMKTGA